MGNFAAAASINVIGSHTCHVNNTEWVCTFAPQPSIPNDARRLVMDCRSAATPPSTNHTDHHPSLSFCYTPETMQTTRPSSIIAALAPRSHAPTILDTIDTLAAQPQARQKARTARWHVTLALPAWQPAAQTRGQVIQQSRWHAVVGVDRRCIDIRRAAMLAMVPLLSSGWVRVHTHRSPAPAARRWRKKGGGGPLSSPYP